MFDEIDFLGQLLSYDVVRHEMKEYTVKYEVIETEHGYHFSLEKDPAMGTWNFFREGVSSCGEPTHRIPEFVMSRIQEGEEYFMYVCETCMREQKTRKFVTVADVSGYIESTEFTPYLGKNIIFRTKMDDGLIKREVYCTRPTCESNLVEYLEE